MAKESTQQKLSRVRPPRVQITYDVETGDAIEKKELPFVLGIVGDYSGNNKPQVRLKDRKFTQIDRDNFDDVLKGMSPSLQMRVDDKLTGQAESQLSVDLKFNRMEDFEPQNVVKQVPPLKKLLELRGQLSDLSNKLVGNDKLGELLDDIVTDTEKLRQISQGRVEK